MIPGIIGGRRDPYGTRYCKMCGRPGAGVLDGMCITCYSNVNTKVSDKTILIGEESSLDEAKKILTGDREGLYDRPSKNLERIATIWSVILGIQVTPRQVALCMAGLKIARESHKHKRDNIVDAIGYLGMIDMCPEKDEVI